MTDIHIYRYNSVHINGRFNTKTKSKTILFAYWVILHAYLSSDNFFQNRISFRNTIRVSNSLDPDLARHFVGLDLGPNY